MFAYEDIFKGFPGFLKILTLVLDPFNIVLTALGFSRPFPDPDRPGSPDPDECQRVRSKAQNQMELAEADSSSSCIFQKHVILDEIVLGIVVAIFVLYIVWIVIRLIDCIKNEGIVKYIDIFIHILAGGSMIAAGVIWSITVSRRSFNMGKCGKDLKCQGKSISVAAKVFGHRNLVFFNYDTSWSDKNPIVAASNGEAAFVTIAVAGALILLTGLLYILIAFALIIMAIIKCCRGDGGQVQREVVRDQTQYAWNTQTETQTP